MSDNKKTVLVVEDEPSLLKIAVTKLEQSGYNTLQATSVTEALSYFEDDKDIDAIWLDHYLSGQRSGIDVVVAAKKNVKYKKVPIVVVTNSTSDQRVLEYVSLGVHDHIGKADHSLSEIVEIIDQCIKESK